MQTNQNGIATATRGVKIFDTTLRDGEQSPGATLHAHEKLEIAEQLAMLGVDIIEAGFPASSPGDMAAVQAIARGVGLQARPGLKRTQSPPTIAAMARANASDIDKAWEGVRDAVSPRIHIVLPTSDIHLKHKLDKTRSEVLELAHRSVAHARSLNDDVEFSPEDATRTDIDFLVEVLEVAVAEGATTINIPDTVGYALPDDFGSLIEQIHGHFKTFDDVVISAHCHNDLGLATANTLAGIASGCGQVEVTVNGIGERAGNACLFETVMALRTRQDAFPIETNIRLELIGPTSELLSKCTGLRVQANKAIVGANAFSHESGIHQDGVLKNRMTYEIIDRTELGLSNSAHLVLGKHSGRSALRARLDELGYSMTAPALEEVFRTFKDLADAQKCVSTAELREICRQQRAIDLREPSHAQH